MSDKTVNFSVTLYKCDEFPDVGFTVECTCHYRNYPHTATCPGESLIEDIEIQSISTIWHHYSSDDIWFRTPGKEEHDMALRSIRNAVDKADNWHWQAMLNDAAKFACQQT